MSGKSPEISMPEGSTQSPAGGGSKSEVSVVSTSKIPQGRPKSGRVWKDRNKKRFSAMVKDRPLCTSWEQKMKVRQEKRLLKDFAKHLKDEKQREKEEKKSRREENLKRRLENERKAEIVQVIRNPLKLKRAKKKQLRRIEKRDTLKFFQQQQQMKTNPAKAKRNAPGPL
uniref:Coiled-coil domain-containing protein 86 n=1 Tax=Geotrypetes seraphini TaxID=260995 RepID=A0A6P8NKN7_GEOSA|nr:coiled-coil domain-containing protein 86 [Geotrypetes seraphini]XP_033776593.1 coiled-coil domain-containing protein 86 [Geotrypetes seraphini]XP_033776594.1 coiled-coil domain-containing protein 86 [Geotrypetes seraphini]XP_033776595.1 coiled-coil domain-containing protein 86 [Geotrypetes seraphini]